MHVIAGFGILACFLFCKPFKGGSFSSVYFGLGGNHGGRQKVRWDSGSHPQRVFRPKSHKWEVPFGTNLVKKESKNGQRCHTQADEWKKDVLEPCYEWDYLTDHFIMLNIYTSSWVLWLGIILPLCSSLCGEMQGKSGPMTNTSRAAYTFICWFLKILKEEWMSPGVHFIWVMQPCCDSAADLTTRTDYQSRAAPCLCLPKIISWRLPVID